VVASLGEKLHCFNHCLVFIKAEPDERLRQVTKYGDCTVCLMRDYITDANIAGRKGKLETFELYEKVSKTYCSSIQNASFHG
jgi:hypothetical protein